MPFVTEVKVEYNILLFIIKDVALVCAYLLPEHSPYYKLSKIDSGVCTLEHCLADLNVKFDVDFIVCGDMNARTKNYPVNMVQPAQKRIRTDHLTGSEAVCRKRNGIILLTKITRARGVLSGPDPFFHKNGSRSALIKQH